MGTSICRPSSLRSSGTAGWATSAASLLAAASDNSDTTYIIDNIAGSGTLGHQVWFNLGAPSPAIPAGAVIRKITPKARMSQAGGGQRIAAEIRAYSSNRAKLYYSAGGNFNTPTATIKTFSYGAGRAWLGAPSGSPEASVAYLSTHLEMFAHTDLSLAYSAAGDDRIYDMWAEIEWDEEPTATPVLNPTDAATRTSRPGIDIGYSDPEGSQMRGYRVVVWTAADAADPACPKAAGKSFTAADGSVHTAIAATGSGTGTSVYAADDTWFVSSDLPNGALVAFVQVADDVLGTARWQATPAQLSWTQNVTNPPGPTAVTAAWVGSPTWAVQVNVTVAGWAHAPGTVRQIEVHRSTDGGLSWTLVPAGLSPGLSGQSGATVTVWDAALPHGRSALYRARELHDDGTYQYASPWLVRGSKLSVDASTFEGGGTGSVDAWAAVGGTCAVTAQNTQARTGSWSMRIEAIGTPAAAEAKLADGASDLTISGGQTARVGWGVKSGLTSRIVQLVVDWFNGGTPLGSTTLSQVDSSTGWAYATNDVTAPAGTTRYELRTRVLSPVNTERHYIDDVTVTLAVTGQIDRWLLRDPADPATAPLQLQIGSGLASSSREAVAFFQPVGSAVEVKIAQAGAVGGEVWTMPITLRGEAAYQALLALRARQSTLLLQGDMTGWARWVGIGQDMRPTLLNSTSRLTSTLTPRTVDLELRELAAPAGQPQQP